MVRSIPGDRSRAVVWVAVALAVLVGLAAAAVPASAAEPMTGTVKVKAS
jgi:hypothetical protein